MRGSKRGFWTALAVIVLSALLGGIYGPRVEATGSKADDVQDVVRNFTKIFAIVEQNYADPVDPDRAIYQGAIPGMLRTLDPHSSFLDPRAFNLLREDQRGHYFGVGMQVGPRDGRTIVHAPFPGSPAYKVGLRPGDVILRVDDTPTDGLTTSEVADLLKGPKGTVVRVWVSREGFDEPLHFTITRDEIPRLTVDFYFHLQPGVGYVRVAHFNENTHEELAKTLDKLGVDTLEGLVLDLRGNPGGLLNECVAVADMFLEKNQLIVTHRGRTQRERRYFATRGNGGRDFSLVILIDRYTASAAEIVSGAIQDHDRGLIVGETSFGKGLVQTVYPLSQGTGMALTTSRYYTPSGRLIQRDFAAVSLYSYYYGNNRDNNSHEIYSTDSGRTVYGGGGITPDIELSRPELTPFQETLMRRLVIYPFEVGIGDFAKRYLARHPEVPRDFQVDDSVLTDLRLYLNERNLSFTESDIQSNLDWIKLHIKKEVVLSAFGLDEGRKVAIQGDPHVQRALELLPAARQLTKDAEQTIAKGRRKQ